MNYKAATLILFVNLLFFSQKGLPFSSAKQIDSAEHNDLPVDCNKKKLNSKTDFISLYKAYDCQPLKSLNLLFEDHTDKTWIFKALVQKKTEDDIAPKDKLKLLTFLKPFAKSKTSKEKNLLDTLALKKQLGLDSASDQAQLYADFPSHDPKKNKTPDLLVVKDFKRRGLHKEALKLLKNLYKKNPSNKFVQKQLTSVQKNIKRDEQFLFFSQRYTDFLYKEYKKNKKHRFKRRDYLNEALLNIRRIWTYRSTEQAYKKLKILIKYHCILDSECAEHYWILGRIYDEKNNPSQARIWLKKGVDSTSLKSSEFISRLWNLIWLESKYLSEEQALKTAKQHIKKLPEKEVSSKVYFWMSRWEKNPQLQKTYKDLLLKHHPLSFYVWSPMAAGLKLDVKKKKITKIKISNSFEETLLKLTQAKVPELTRTYVKFIEKNKIKKKTMTWKKLKALNGMYADLLLDLEAGNIKLSDHLPYFFSKSFENIVTENAIKQKIPKELIWSIIRQESNFNATARSWADAFGLMQILEKRAVEFLNKTQNVNVAHVTPVEMYDPSFNINVGAWLLRENLNIFSNKLPFAIAAYNANIEKVKEWENRFYKDDYLYLIEEITYRETRKYVKLVLRNIEIYRTLN